MMGLYGLCNLRDLQNIESRLSLKGSTEIPTEESFDFIAGIALATAEKVHLLNTRNSKKPI